MNHYCFYLIIVKSSENEESGGGAAFLTLFLILGISISIWMIYAYYNPHTSSGQLLIKVSKYFKTDTSWNSSQFIRLLKYSISYLCGKVSLTTTPEIIKTIDDGIG